MAGCPPENLRHPVPLSQVVYAAGDQVLVSCSYDRSVRVWDCRSRAWDPVQTMADAGDSVTALASTPRGEILAASVDGCLRRYDARAGRVFVDSLPAALTSVALTGDGAMVLLACMDSTLRLLDREDGDPLVEYKGKPARACLLVLEPFWGAGACRAWGSALGGAAPALASARRRRRRLQPPPNHLTQPISAHRAQAHVHKGGGLPDAQR